LPALQEKVLQCEADLGIAFDGDGDRVMMVDAHGHVINGDQLLYIMAQTRQILGESPEGVVGTLMSNMALAQALDRMNIPFARAAVGDRYVLQKMLENGWTLGGESSGHLVDLHCSTTGDGIVSALRILTAISLTGKSLADLLKDFQPFPQILRNIPLQAGQEFKQTDTLNKAIQAAEKKLGPWGQVLIRPSGTEPLVRIMAQADNEDVVQQVVDDLIIAVQKSVPEVVL